MDKTFEVKLTSTDLYTILKMADGCFTVCKYAIDSNSRDELAKKDIKRYKDE